MGFKHIYKSIPNLVTLLNLFFGCLAIIYFLKVDEGIIFINSFDSIVVRYPQEFWYGSLCVGIAAILDFFDGALAKWLKAPSEIGKQLDSLADIVSFGVAPSVLMYQLLYIALSRNETFTHVPIFFVSIAFLLALSSAYRLAKFNTLESKTYFVGMPTPAVGLFIASLVPLYWTDYYHLNSFIFQPYILYIILFLLSFLMNSKIKFYSLKNIKLNNPFVLSIISLFIILMIFAPIIVFPIFFIGYILVSLFHQSRIT